MMERYLRAVAILLAFGVVIFAHAFMLLCGDGPYCSGG